MPILLKIMLYEMLEEGKGAFLSFYDVFQELFHISEMNCFWTELNGIDQCLWCMGEKFTF